VSSLLGSSLNVSRTGSPAPKLAEGLAAAAGGSYGACFGLVSGGPSADGEVVAAGVPPAILEEPPAALPLLPPSTTGLRNIGACHGAGHGLGGAGRSWEELGGAGRSWAVCGGSEDACRSRL